MKSILTFFLLVLSLQIFSQEIQSFEYEKFKNPNGLSRTSDAIEKKNKIILTPSVPNRRGALWFSKNKMIVSDSFDISFCFRIYKNGGKKNGGEGLAFLIHNNEFFNKNGEKGEGLGYAGIANSLAVEFDVNDTEDMGGPHVSVQSQGIYPNSHGKSASLAAMPLDINLKDGDTHTARINYVDGTMTIYLDSKKILSAPLDITEILNLDSGSAWVGITSATGKSHSVQELSCFSMTSKEREIPYISDVGRNVKKTKKIIVRSKEIKIRVWDINVEDGDIISVNLNGKWVLDHFVLTKVGDVFDFTLEEQGSYLILHAHNLGEIPPNTAGISITDKYGMQETVLRSNMYESDALLIEYHKESEKGDISRYWEEGEKPED